MVALPLVQLGRAARRRGDPERLAVERVGDAVVGPAEAERRPDHGVEHDLEVEHRAAHDREDLVVRGLPVDRLALRVVEALAGERARDPGLEDRRVDGLRQVVGGAHREAADDAVELVDAGDDDDRDVPQGRIRGERGERLVAVHHRHDDVEEDDVDRRRAGVPQPLERDAAVLGLDRLMADAAQQLRQQQAVERGVVDDEDAPGLGRAVAGGWRHAATRTMGLMRVLRSGWVEPWRSPPRAPRGGWAC